LVAHFIHWYRQPARRGARLVARSVNEWSA
jgi:hypothetical protein